MKLLGRDPQKEIKRALGALGVLNRDPYGNAITALGALNRDPFKNLKNIMQNIDSDPLKRLRESMAYLMSDKLSKMLGSEDQNEILQALAGVKQPLMDIGAYSVNGEAVISLCHNTDLNDDKFSEELMSYLERMFEKLLAQSSSVLGLSFYCGVLITVINVWYSDYSSSESEKRILDRMKTHETRFFDQISAIENKLSDEIKALNKNNLEQQTFYIVRRNTYLREKPKDKARRILVLYLNQKTELKARKGKWIQVEFFDYLTETYTIGWVKKKYLKSCKLN